MRSGGKEVQPIFTGVLSKSEREARSGKSENSVGEKVFNGDLLDAEK
jgi:hypothetical protein